MFLALTLFWLMWQMVAVALYPRLVEPGFKLATRNAAVLIGKNLLIIAPTMLFIVLLLAITAFLPAIGLVLTVSFVVVLLTNMVDVLLKRELLTEDA
jgi:hypothetical protein